MGSAGRPSFFRWASLSSFTPGAFTAECQPGPSTTKSPSLPRFFDQIGGSGGRVGVPSLGGGPSSLIFLIIVMPSGGGGSAKRAAGGGALAFKIRAEESVAPGAHSP